MSARRRSQARPHKLEFHSHELPVELYGDFVHWFAPQALQRSESDRWETTLHLTPGVYAYKFRTHDGAWHLDPKNVRTRSLNGLRNSLLVIGGSDEPVLHAPVFPLAFVEADGRLCLRAGLRRNAGERLALHIFFPGSDGAKNSGWRDLPMRRIGEEDEHLLFEIHLPTAAATLDYLFRLESGEIVGRGGPGGPGGQSLHVELSALRATSPDWWQGAVLYTIFLDRFRRGAKDALPSPSADERGRLGGDLFGVRQALPYLRDLGVTVLHLTPIALSNSAHRYDAQDPLTVDPALGGEAALAALIEDAHRLGLRVLLDVVLTHVHRDFLPFCEVRERGRASTYADWFSIQRHPFFEGQDPGYRHYQKGQWQEPLLNTDHEEVVEYLASIVAHYAGLGVDGFRLDAAADVPLALLLRLRAAARAVRADAVLFGEVTPHNTWRYTSEALDAATDFGHQQVLYDWLWHRHIDARQAAAALSARGFARGSASSAVVFTATHDQPRFATVVQNPARARLAQLVTLLGAAIPAIYYGDEIGLCSDDPARAFEDAWPDRLPMRWESASDSAAADSRSDGETFALFREALRLRKQQPALQRGSLEYFAVSESPDVLAFRRAFGEDLIEVYVYAPRDDQAAPCTLRLPSGPSQATLLLSLNAATAHGQTLRLPALSAAVVSRHAAPELSARWQAAKLDNRARCAAAFHHGELAGLFLPTHLYLTVTERCNLRCAHCITDAPKKTFDGRARTMQPWLLDALDEALGAADYFGFVHGGESLVAPIFFELLARIAKAHAGRPYDAHLLSNGMRLCEDTVEQLAELGINSLSISLDGGSAQTNDALRLGADFERILQNLEDALKLRARRGLDLRIGVSTVVTQSNVDELAQLGARLCALGIDWIKVEEMYEVNALSRRELILPRSRRAQAALLALRAAVEPSGVLVVDHLQKNPPAGCLCQAKDDAELLEFRVTDDFANRTCFLPCRAAWAQACIDPDGAVRPIDYAQPPLGNLAAEPLLSLWHGEAMQRRRAAALTRIPSSLRTTCAR